MHSLVRAGSAGMTAALLAASCASGDKEPPVLDVGSTVRGAWSSRDSIFMDHQADRIALSLVHDRRVRIALRTDEPGARLALLSAGGDRLEVLPVTSSVASFVYLPRPTTEDHVAWLSVEAPRRAETRRYALEMVEVSGSFAPPGQTAIIRPGESREGLLETFDNRAWLTRPGQEEGGRFDRFHLAADSGTAVTITVSSTEFDPILSIRAPSGELAAFDDDGGGGTTAELSLVVPRDTTTFAVISLGNHDEARYLVSIVTAAGRRQVTADSVPGSISFEGRPPLEYVACRGRPMRRSLAYDSTRTGRHVTALVQTDHSGNFGYDRWGATYDRPVELVLCLTHEPRNVGTECRYRGAPSVQRVQHGWRGRLVAAQSATLIASLQVDGDMPRECGSVEAFSRIRIDGSLAMAEEAAAAMESRLARYIMPDSIRRD